MPMLKYEFSSEKKSEFQKTCIYHCESDSLPIDFLIDSGDINKLYFDIV